MKNSQRGISLIVIFLVMTVALNMVLGLSTVLFNKIKVSGSKENSLSALYAAESGIEKTLYFDRKQIPGKGKNKGNRGLCNICNICTDCENCTSTAISTGGCDTLTCTDCKISYNSVFSGRDYQIQAQAIPSLFLSCSSEGKYKNTRREIEITSTSISSVPLVK